MRILASAVIPATAHAKWLSTLYIFSLWAEKGVRCQPGIRFHKGLGVREGMCDAFGIRLYGVEGRGGEGRTQLDLIIS